MRDVEGKIQSVKAGGGDRETEGAQIPILALFSPFGFKMVI
jgi:hypothetical protein